jgi:hypothetical protein
VLTLYFRYLLIINHFQNQRPVFKKPSQPVFAAGIHLGAKQQRKASEPASVPEMLPWKQLKLRRKICNRNRPLGLSLEDDNDDGRTENTIKICTVRRFSLLVGRPEGRRPLGRRRRRWEENIKMDIMEIGFGDVDWIHWAQDRDRWRALVNTVMNLWVP